MRDHRFPVIAAFALFALLSAAAHAHEPFMDCFDNGDGTITCRGGYEDGAPPNAEDRILIRDGEGATVEQGHFDAEGTYTFEPPGADYSMVFSGTEMGHTLRLRPSDVIR